MSEFSGLGLNLGNLSRLSTAKSRSISPENFTGEKGKGGMSVDGPAANAARGLGQGWKISPYILIDAGKTFTLADIEGEGAIQQIWMTLARGKWRHTILRIYWDDQDQPSVECPAGDFFACGWEEYAQVSSLAVCVNPGRAFNCYWEMPFRKRARITMENLSDEQIYVYYQINYALTAVPEDCAYFHAQFRRTNPLPYKQDYTILDGASGRGHYVGTYMAWGVNNSGWWGEGEIKFFLDGDKTFPTICGTGTEDYFCGAYNFDPGGFKRAARQDGVPGYVEFNTPYAGLTVSTNRRRASACIAGTSWTRSASRPICASRFRRSAGARTRTANIYRCRTTSRRWHSGTRHCPQPRFRHCRIATISKSSEERPCRHWFISPASR